MTIVTDPDPLPPFSRGNTPVNFDFPPPLATILPNPDVMATAADLAIERLLTQLTEAQVQNSDILTKLTTTRNEATKLKIGPPTEFTGKSEETRRFIQQCESHFTADPRATDDQKIECALSYMKGEYPSMFVDEVRALRLLIPKRKIGDSSNLCDNWSNFVEKFREVFSEKDAQAKAQAKLMHIRQGNRSAGRVQTRVRTVPSRRQIRQSHLDHVLQGRTTELALRSNL